jgi:hypothetical protein
MALNVPEFRLWQASAQTETGRGSSGSPSTDGEIGRVSLERWYMDIGCGEMTMVHPPKGESLM